MDETLNTFGQRRVTQPFEDTRSLVN
jgi:hypothetical protein